MSILDTNRSQITNGGLISASFVSDLYDILTGNEQEDINISGSINIINSSSIITSQSGSINHLNVSESFITNGTILFYTASLPTTDPNVNGQLWRSGSFLQISLGTGSL